MHIHPIGSLNSLFWVRLAGFAADFDFTFKQQAVCPSLGVTEGEEAACWDQEGFHAQLLKLYAPQALVSSSFERA
jgi:hypothetical protein